MSPRLIVSNLVCYCVILPPSQNINKNWLTKVVVFSIKYVPDTLTCVDLFYLYFGIEAAQTY
jgi:hypothetical protein